jgi:hypothetical protein
MKNLIYILLISSIFFSSYNERFVLAADKKIPKIGFIKKQLTCEATGSHCTFTNGSASAKKTLIFIDALDGSYMNLDGQDTKIQYLGNKKSDKSYTRLYEVKNITIQLNNRENSNKSTFTISNDHSSKIIKAICWSNEG